MRHPIGSLVLAGVMLAGCAVSEASTDDGVAGEGDDAIVDTTEQGLSAASYAYFTVTRDRLGRSWVSAVNDARVRCASGRAARACPLSSLDLRALGLTAGEARDVVRALDSDPDAPTLVFLGRLVRGARGALGLTVAEAWRAPKPAPVAGTFFHVRAARSSPQAQVGEPTATALRLNAWARARFSGVELEGAPGVEDCRFVPASAAECTSPYEPARAALATDAGLLVVGARDAEGRLVATQTFLKINVGVACDDGGFNYCGPALPCDRASHECRLPPKPGTVGPLGRGRLGKVAYERAPELASWLGVLDVALLPEIIGPRF